MDGKPTLIGMSREEMVAAMADAGVPEDAGQPALALALRARRPPISTT
jgi:hypothetical protein